MMKLGRKELEFYFNNSGEELEIHINNLLAEKIITGPDEFGDYDVKREELDAYAKRRITVNE